MDALVGPGDAVADGGMQIGTVSSKACASVFKASAGLYIETLEVGGNCDDIRIVRNIEQSEFDCGGRIVTDARWG